MVIAIVGADGSGKTTQSQLLTARLRDEGYQVLCIRPMFVLMTMLTGKEKSFKWVSPRRTQVKTVQKKSGWTVFHKLIMVLPVFFYILATHVYIRLFLERKTIVVCDRYFYQLLFDLLGGSFSLKIIKLIPHPDLTVFMHIGDRSLYIRQKTFDREVSRDYFVEFIEYLNALSNKLSFIKLDGTMDRVTISRMVCNAVIQSDKIMRK